MMGGCAALSAHNITKAIVIILGCLFCHPAVPQERAGVLFAAVEQDPKLPSVAIMEPTGNANVSATDKLTVRGTLTEFITNSKKYKVLDRNHIDQLLKEHDFQRNGMVDPAEIKEVGKMLGADVVCTLELLKEGSVFIANASLIDVVTGEVGFTSIEMTETHNALEVKNLAEKIGKRMLGRDQREQGQSEEDEMAGREHHETIAIAPRGGLSKVNYGLQLGAMMPMGDLSDQQETGVCLAGFYENVFRNGFAARVGLEYAVFGKKEQPRPGPAPTDSMEMKQIGVMFDLIYYKALKDLVYPFAGIAYLSRSAKNESDLRPGRENAVVGSEFAVCAGLGINFTRRLGIELKSAQCKHNWVQLSLLWRF